MGSQRAKVIRLSDLAPTPNYDALTDELNGKESKDSKKPQRLNLLGSVKEKGFSIDTLPRHRISLPQPRVSPFPAARHRSDGPHWGPSSSKDSSDPVIELNGDDRATGMSAAAEMAMPLNRRQSAQSLTSKWRSNRKSELNIRSQIQNAYDDTRQDSTPHETSKASIMESESLKLLEVVAGEKDSITKATLMDDKRDMGRAYSKPAQQLTHSGPNVSTDRDIDAENRKAIFAMSPEEVDEAQAELSQKLRPELLGLLRKRGAEKEGKRLAEKVGTSVAAKVSEGSNRFQGYKKEVADQYSSPPAEDDQSVASIQRVVQRMSPSDQTKVRGTKVGPADLLTTSFAQVETASNHAAEESFSPLPTTDRWTLRVEAVRSLRFDLNGSVVSTGPSPQSNNAFESNSPAGVLHNTLSVVERDYLRTEGDPIGAGYSLKECLALVRSTVPGQRAVALHILASLLDNAIQGLQEEKFNPSSALLGEGVRGKVDWQAIWAYVLGPEAEVVLTLRLALDDGHSTVVAACARSIQALLSYSANEGYFDSLEALWPGDNAVYTAPVFRRKTKHDEGFIGGGRWKYNVKTSEMFPSSDTANQEKSEEDGKETVADDSHVSNKDVAAGLVRMGVLPRIRYILEVDQLIAAEDALLSVLICLARHSPAAAHAVMTCPRLIDVLRQRFIGTDFCESWSARSKAIRLLKVLSQAKKANCVHFESIGILQTMMGPLLRQSYANDPSGHARELSQGYYEVMIETVRFWRVCIDYGIGISLFSDCYSILCFWLLPLSKEEILGAVRDESLSFARESYLLLEHIARTLPSLHASGDLVAHVDGVNWSWSVAQAILYTAMKWLSPECISGVHMLLEPYLQVRETQPLGTIQIKTSATRVLGIVASVLNFLATVCEKVVSEDQLHCALEDPDNLLVPWFPTFLPHLGLALARSGLLSYSQLDLQSHLPKSTLQSDMSTSAMEPDLGACTLVPEMPVSNLEKKSSFLKCLHFCQTQADNDSALVAINCLNALVRVNSVVDILISIGKPKATSPLEDQTPAHRILERGLLLSAERELRSSLDLCEKNVIFRTGLLQMSVRGGPAPGVGMGWGSLCGGVWSKEVIISQASARLALDLMSVFSSRIWLSQSDNDGDKVMEELEPSQQLPRELSSRVNFCLSIIATSTIVNRELVLRACSHIIFHPSTLSILMQKIGVLLSWGTSRAQEKVFKIGSHPAEDKYLDQDYASTILLKHCKDFWLAIKRKCKDGTSYKVSPKRKSSGFGPDLETVDEESGEGHISHPESLMMEWVGQRLPLPSHWFLSPLVGDLILAAKRDGENVADSVIKETTELEEVIKAGLVFFLGFEVFAADVSEAECINTKIPIVRKLHSLSTVFVSGSDVFLDPIARDLIRALQKLIGNQIGMESTKLSQHSTEGRTGSEDGLNGVNGHGYEATAVLQRDTTPGDVMDKESIMPALDFEGSIDPSYLNYAEVIAEQFVATSFGDHVFARQVAFHLCPDVPVMIRLATWRVLTDGRVLELLPPLTQCAGPPQKYLYPIEANQQMLESFASSWTSGALNKSAKRNSLSFTLASHHLAGYLFDTLDTAEILLLKKKTARALVRSTVAKLDHQEMLLRLVHYVPAWCPSNGERATEGADIEQLKLRLSFLRKACEGDSSLTAEVQNLQKLVVSKVRGLNVGGG